MAQQSLFDDDFGRSDKSTDRAIAKKSNAKSTKKTPTTVRSGGLSGRIQLVRDFVEEHLGKYRDSYVTITTEEELATYIDKCCEVGCVAIDTETTGLNPMLDKIVGVCLYYPNGNPAYIPIRHISYITGEHLDNQLSPETVAKHLERLVGIKECEMFNAKFDTRFIYNDLGVKLHCTWDGYLAARLMNENEEHTNLKFLHSKYVLNGEEDEFSFSDIFTQLGIKVFDIVPIDIATLYGAHDAVITHEFKVFQAKYMYYEPECAFEERNGMNGVAWCFFNIEMPLVDVMCDLEDTGILLDTNYAKKLSVEYHEKREQALQKFYDLTANIVYPPNVDISKLDNPINIGSPTQLAILFYDILGYEVVDDRKPRGTGEDILLKWNTELTQAILEYRGIDKLLGTYIDKIPRENVNPNDGRVHASFNQYGADTGRMSSDRPNLQNIPHDKTRKMFVASRGEELIEDVNNSFSVDRWCEVCTTTGWKYVDTVKVGDCLVVDDDGLSSEIIVRKINTVVDKNQIVFYY